jgi:F-type H+-transporting ATPase subunit b
MRIGWNATAGALCWMIPAVVLASGTEGGADPLQLDPWQAGFSIAVFVILVLILGRVAFKPILVGLQRREKFIHDSLESAKRDREQAEERLKELMDRLQRARDEAGAIVDEGRRDGDAAKRRIEDEARKSAEALLDRAKREIGVARDTALRDLHEESAKLAMDMAGAVLKRQLQPEDHRRLIGEALAQLKQRGAGGKN